MEMTVDIAAQIPEALEPRTLAFKRARRFRGMPALSGDHGLAYQALALASLAEGPTRLENLPDTPALREAMNAFATLGLLRSEMLDGQIVVHGGSLGQSAEIEATAKITVRDESLALLLAGVMSGKQLHPSLAADSHAVGEDVVRLIREAMPATPEQAGRPIPSAMGAGITEDASTEGALPPAMIELQPGPLAPKVRRARESGLKPRAFKWDDSQAKLLFLTQALASRESALLELRDPGSDLFETLIAHFHGPLQVDRGEPPEGDELARRIARQMKAAGNKEDLVRFRLEAGATLKPGVLTLPRDVGEASLFALIATLLKGSDLVLEHVLLNPSRTAFFSALRRMGADLEVVSRREKHGFAYGQVRVRSSELIAKRFDGEALAGMREEVFLLLVAAAFAEGETVLRDVTFLRGYREDLLKAFLATLKSAGVEAGEFEDGVVVRGRPDYDGAAYDALGHPGLAAACVAMALKSHGNSTVTGAEGLLWRMPHLMGQLEALQADAKDKDAKGDAGEEDA